MNLKGLGAPQITTAESTPKLQKTREVKTESSADRDADGRQQKGQDHSHEQLTEEMAEKALEKVKKLPGVEEHNLSAKVEKHGDRFFIIVEDHLGKVIRRIPPTDIWNFVNPALDEPQTKTGQLFHREM